MKIIQIKRLYLPAISILAVVLFLLILMSVSTYHNLDRYEKTVLKFVHQQGLTIIDALEAGARTGIIIPLQEHDSIERLIRETSGNEGIAYIYLIDLQGTLLHHSDLSPPHMSSIWRPQFDEKEKISGRVYKLKNGTQIYDLAKKFSPSPSPIRTHGYTQKMNHGDDIFPHQHSDSIIVVGLKMTAYEAARHSDIQHSIIMAAILVILGSGTLFFIFVIQNYYLVDKTLKQTEDYARQVVANMASGLLSIDLKGRIVSYNRLALELLGLEESKVKGMNLNTVINFDKIGIDGTLSSGKAVLERELLHQQKNGDLVPMTISVTPIVEEEKTYSGAVIVLRDLREIKRLENKIRHSEKLAAIGKLAAGVAHEIRNPLSSIRGFARFLAHSLSERPKDREYAEIMVKEVDRINAVVNDLLTYARPMEPELELTNFSELIEHAVRLVEADAHQRNVSIHLNIDSNLNKYFLDANQITQALLNLILNALQEIGRDGAIEIGIKEVDSDRQLLIWVEDNGPGIPPEIKEKVFDPFFTTREKGTGLGLAIVQKIIENHHGDIRLESPLPNKDRGCRFSISLPANPVDSL